MSALAGLVRFGGTATEEEAEAMARTMAHRAPDRAGVWSGGAVALAHRALWTTPESLHETFPLVRGTPEGPVALVSDARIDNRDELIDVLKVRPLDGEPITDADLLLAAYLAWGKACPDRLVGDFAFVVWDGRGERPRLFAARDPFGVRPLYYHAAPGLFAFGTEAKALLALPEVPHTWDEVAIGYHLASFREDAARTIFADIRLLPGAHALCATADGVDVWRYYTPRPAPGVGPMTDEGYAARFRELFTEAVRCRIRSAYPVGAQLSGGLDSSGIACVARDLLRAQDGGALPTFSLTFDAALASDERAYAEEVLATGGFEPHWVPGDGSGPLGNLSEVYAVLDDGLVAGTQHLVWALFQAAQRANVRIVLDGFDGDTVVDHGHLRLGELAQTEDWATFGHEARALAARFREADHRQNFEDTFVSAAAVFQVYGRPVLDERARTGPAWKYLRSLRGAVRHAGADARKELSRVWRRLLVPAPFRKPPPAPAAAAARLRDTFVSPAFAARIGLAERIDAGDDPFPSTVGRPVRERQRAVLGMGSLTGGLGLMTQMAAVLGLEVAHPFMDRRLVEFCLALPPEQSLRGGWTRAILRHALAHTLPPGVAWRVGKADMTAGVGHALFEVEGDVLTAIVRDPGPLAPYLDRGRLEAALDLGGASDPATVAGLTRTAILAYWLQRRSEGAGGQGDTPPGAQSS